MPKLPRWTAADAERELLLAAFGHLRSKGSHRIYGKGQFRVTVPFHSGAILHPKIIKQILAIIAEAAETPSEE
jgi:predicted RNA binding protein YcfA (HicA-like mRNA interferase family)